MPTLYAYVPKKTLQELHAFYRMWRTTGGDVREIDKFNIQIEEACWGQFDTRIELVSIQEKEEYGFNKQCAQETVLQLAVARTLQQLLIEGCFTEDVWLVLDLALYFLVVGVRIRAYRAIHLPPLVELGWIVQRVRKSVGT